MREEEAQLWPAWQHSLERKIRRRRYAHKFRVRAPGAQVELGVARRMAGRALLVEDGLNLAGKRNMRGITTTRCGDGAADSGNHERR